MTDVRAALLIDHPIQYFAAGLRRLAAHPELRTRVYYWNAATDGLPDPDFGRHIQWKTDMHSGYDWWSAPAGGSQWRRGLAVLRQLRHDRPQVLLSYGWGSSIARLGICFATLTGTPLLYYGDSHPSFSVTGRHDRVRRLVLRRLFRRAAGAISTGVSNQEFYLDHGLEPGLVHPGVLPADVGSFSAAATHRRPPDPGRGSEAPIVLGFVGKLVPHKAVADLIEAAARLPQTMAWQVWLIGDGPLRNELEQLAVRRGLAERVRFLGFKNTDELPSLMSLIDIVVMPSRRDARGLVAVEAMAAGAATIVSSATGVWGPGDVLQHERSGLVFPVGDVEALAACLRRLMDDHDLRTRLAAAGQARAMSYGPEQFAAATAAALVSTVRRQADVLSR